MKQRKIPMRTCVVTKEKCEKMNLIRIVRTKEGNVEIDLTGKKNGRGAYLKKDIEVIEKAKQSKLLNRLFECDIDDKVYEEAKELIKNA